MVLNSGLPHHVRRAAAAAARFVGTRSVRGSWGTHIQLALILCFHLPRVPWVLFAPLQCNLPGAKGGILDVGIALATSADAW